MDNFDTEAKLCPCGSGEDRFPLHDARGIFVSYVCDQCEKEVKNSCRPEIFEDCNYDTFGEQVEDDY